MGLASTPDLLAQAGVTFVSGQNVKPMSDARTHTPMPRDSSHGPWGVSPLGPRRWWAGGGVGCRPVGGCGCPAVVLGLVVCSRAAVLDTDVVGLRGCGHQDRECLGARLCLSSWIGVVCRRLLQLR